MSSPNPTITRNSVWYRLPISYRGAIIIAIPAICLLATLGAWIWSRQTGVLVDRQIEHTENILAQTNQLLISILDAETGVRGYSIGRQDRFLEPYQQARQSLPTTLDRLEKLTRYDSQQYQKVQNIKQLSQQKISTLEQKIRIIDRQSVLTNSPELKRLLSKGKLEMDSIREAIRTLQAEEQAFLEAQSESLEDVRQITTLVQWLTAFISAIAYWAAVYLFSQLDEELQERESQLQESTTFIEAITGNVIDGVMTITRQNQIETFNPAAAEIFGYKPSEVIGQDIALLLVDPRSEGQERQEKVHFLHTDLQQKEGRWQTIGHSKDGTDFPIEISVSNMTPYNRFMVIIRDITENEAAKDKLRTRAEELAHLSAILAKTNSDLEKQNQELDKFAYVASHDLKAPLRAIANLSSWIEEDLGDRLIGETQYHMHLLRGRVQRLENLINGLLEYSRIGRAKFTVERVDIKELIEEIVDSIAPPESFKLEIAANMPIFRTQKLLLRQIFSNLISNAIGHHDRLDGKVTISVRELERFYEFAVADDGPGIPSEYYDKIFVIFQTLQARDTKENTGIGLSIVKKILEAEGGQIWIESAENVGTTFYFTWPKQFV